MLQSMTGTVRTVTEYDGVQLVAVRWDDGTLTETVFEGTVEEGDLVEWDVIIGE